MHPFISAVTLTDYQKAEQACKHWLNAYSEIPMDEIENLSIEDSRSAGYLLDTLSRVDMLDRQQIADVLAYLADRVDMVQSKQLPLEQQWSPVRRFYIHRLLGS